MTDQPEHLDLESENITGDRVQELLDLFPEVGTEGGKVDFDRLRLALGESVDVGKERYGMNWPGKAECFRTIQLPSLGTLLPRPKESVDFDTTQNMIIEGDNLEVLKLLQKSYLGKIKMIYIDPPYNTGNDFIYPDNYAESLQTYLEYTGQIDAEGKKFSTNTDADGRFHSKWMNMMYPRLYLARNLLRDDGVIFISIDDNEYANLRQVTNEVFGEDNVDVMVWRKSGDGRDGKMKNTSTFRKDHEYVLVAFRSQQYLNKLIEVPDFKNEYGNPDGDPRGGYKAGSISRREDASNPSHSNFYKVTSPSGKDFTRQFDVPEDEFAQLDADKRIYWGKSGDNVPAIKIFVNEPREITPYSVLLSKGTTSEGTGELADLFGDEELATQMRPKPVKLLKTLVQVATGESALVLDFFAGTGTTAQAVLELNELDGGRRRFILVQLPEPTAREDYPTVADITKERARRVIAKLDDKEAGQLNLEGRQREDRGFRVFILAESNFTPWNADVAHEAGALEAQLELHIDHIRGGRTRPDLLVEILLKSGFELSTAVERLDVAGTPVYSVAGGALLVCLELELTLDLIRAIALLKPERVVCLDEGFAGNDQLKANAVQIFKTQGVTTFRTV